MIKRLLHAFTWKAPERRQPDRPRLGRRNAGGFHSPTGRAYIVPGTPKVPALRITATCEHCGKRSPAIEAEAQRAAQQAVRRAIDAAVTGEITIPGPGHYQAETMTGTGERWLSVNITR